ncbi:MAG: reverse gyrase [archaeon GB-1867-035]|nr:reverse gyrase [Candidatus Culexmicrobium profundum]
MSNMISQLHAVFKEGCPNCGGEISDIRLQYKLPCKKCIPIPDNEILKKIEKLNEIEIRRLVVKLLKENGTLKEYGKLAALESIVEEVNQLFYKATGSKLWSAQRTWCRRALTNKNFAIIAPTGMGKTVFGIILAIYFASKGKRSYIILPTSLLAYQVETKVRNFAEKLNLNIKILGYHSILKRKKAKETLKEIAEGKFDILITTSYFLPRYFNIIENQKFDFIFVDDVDSFMRRSKNVEKVLVNLGLNEEIINLGFKLIELRTKLRKIFRQRRINTTELNEVRNEILKIEDTIKKYKQNNKVGLLIVSGASIRARRTKRIRLFRELLGFEIGGKAEGIRNIADIYVKTRDVTKKVIELAKKLGSGGLIFTPMDKGSAYAKEITQLLEENGIKATTYEKARGKILEKYRSGEYDILVGIASYRSPLSRGIDLPERVRYAIFAGVPKIKISLDIEEFRPNKAIILLANLRDFIENQRERDLMDKYIADLRRFTAMIRRDEVLRIVEAIKNNEKLDGFYGRVQQLFIDSANLLKEILSREEIKKKIKESPYLSMEIEDKPYIIVPDVVGFIQASGRTSRLYAGGVSKGVAIVVIDDEKAFNGLVRGIRWYVEDVRWLNLNETNLDKIMKEVDKDRKIIRKLAQGKVLPEFKDIVKTALLVVESPSKARTIARFFGTPFRREINGVTILEVSTGDYILSIAASMGHVFDLVTNEGFYGVRPINGTFIPIYSTIKRCNKCNEQFSDPIDKCPICGGKLYDKATIINALKEIASEVDVLLIGTDADAEGEKIGWDIAQALAPYTKEIKRIEFHEVTQRALSKALKNPREVNLKLVEAQILRRIEDRWIGFELSKKVQTKFNRRDLSAGRVQTPVLGWIVKRTIETRQNVREFLQITLENNLKVVHSLPKLKKKEVREIIKKLTETQCEVLSVEIKETQINPPPPFSTDSLLREASTILKYGVKETMTLAQDLFEVGLITYHRTDSTRVSGVGMKIAKDYISEKWGQEYVKLRPWGKEGAHECIRPTRPIDAGRLRNLIALGIMRLAKRLTSRHIALYNLIFKRFIASQMQPAKVVKQKVKLKILNWTLETEGYVEVKEPGYLKIQTIRLIPKVTQRKLKVKDVRHWRASITPMFTEGEIIRLMKEKGIGRPSTYAKILSTLLERRYVILSPRKKLVATKLGQNVYTYLKEAFEKYVSEETTRKLEELMKKVEEGQLNYMDILRNLHEEIKQLSEVGI